VTVLKTSETTFRIFDSRSNLNLASRKPLFDFIRPNILNTISIKNEFQEKNNYHSKKLSLIACREIKSA
jgi:hypothetical protein